MDRFDAMRLFTRIVELGSFTKAANDLGMPRATVTHVIQQLETRLGVRLLQRTTRHVSATLDGSAYYARCLQLMADLEEAETAFDSSAASPKGRLRVDFQGTLAMHFVMPHLPQFLASYPDIELEIGLGDRAVDLVREGIDCVLRVGQLRESSLVARKVASLTQVTCAGSAYLKKMGVPRTLDDLQQHQAVNFFSSVSGKILPFEFLVDGKEREVMMQGRVAVNTAEAYEKCCIDNLGLIQAPRYHIADQLADGRLQEVLPEFRPAPMPVSIMYPHHRQLSRRVRVLVDWLADLMSRGET
ncbi:LysR family transcriptional regulator [Janthinobacterium agaricidamnosum]|uniref:Bacterial regulatory helix-turn-helix, lysR family protein n=1 Tax=Janthinobacterium agaricidamnosum NBRC 102515 = DSM 9628 TaxID=1349767 RepID=W0VDI0_9BURK|nr:LysR family transcriptional regulator [Janthinobacterium agaricidamnosum]CDG85730.1 bacterial regulatory helix-turn-helix, lysR family protein [Janthinobacterium agaricidamnosum NBRC 102515 = DSM 9628]